MTQELKARVSNPEEIQERLEELGAKFKGEKDVRDTFCLSGR